MTWNTVDHHWPELHRLFPNHKDYLGKKVVKSLSDIPAGADKTQYIDKKTDILLRMKNVKENSDIINWFFLKKFQLLVKHVFPILKITDYIARSEFQGRGAIHIHAIVSADGDVTPKDLELAIKSTEYPENDSTENITDENEYHKQLDLARAKVYDFTINHIGLTNLHPNSDPNQWPEISTNVSDIQCLREYFKDVYDSEDMSKLYEARVNLLQRHSCTHHYCLSYAIKNKETNEPMCRFNFPKDIHGFKTDFDELNRIISQSRMKIDEKNENKDIKDKLKEDELVAPNGASIINGKICPIRKHHTVVQHIKEMPLIWGANTEAQIVTSHRQLLMYIVKYVMKAEKPSDAFNRIAKDLLQKEGETIPTRKVFSKLLMNSIDRDKSCAECFLIAQVG